jgi:hypothetical protein
VQGAMNCGRNPVQEGRKIAIVSRGQSLLTGLGGGVGEVGASGVGGAGGEAGFSGFLGDSGLAGASTCCPVVLLPTRVIAFLGKLGNSAPGTAPVAPALSMGALLGASSPKIIIGEPLAARAASGSRQDRMTNKRECMAVC